MFRFISLHLKIEHLTFKDLKNQLPFAYVHPYLGLHYVWKTYPGLLSAMVSRYASMEGAGSPLRRAATRETTGPLKAWLSEHKKNPYPTKAEKIMLAIITRMTLTQVNRQKLSFLTFLVRSFNIHYN